MPDQPMRSGAATGRAGEGSGRPALWVVTATALIAGLFGVIAFLAVWFVNGRGEVRPLAVRSEEVVDAVRSGAVRDGFAGGLASTGSTLYALDARDGGVLALRLSGELIRRWQVGGDGRTELVRPADIAAGADGTVYVLDAATGFVSKYDGQGRPRGRLLGPDAAVYEPQGLAVDANGAVFVADTGKSRLLRVGPDGTVTVLGRPGQDRDGLREPVGLRCDRSGSLYVADSGNGRIKKLSADGRTLAVWTLPGNPAYVALDGRGRIFTSSPSSGFVFALSPVDGVVASVGAPTRETTPFHRPLGVEVVAGRLYVTDGGEVRVYEPASG